MVEVLDKKSLKKYKSFRFYDPEEDVSGYYVGCVNGCIKLKDWNGDYHKIGKGVLFEIILDGGIERVVAKLGD